MNLRCSFFHLALVASPPAPTASPRDDDDAPRIFKAAANDNHRIWPLLPFPEDWCASS